MSRGLIQSGPVFVVDRLPVQAAGLGLPVLVAYRGPDSLEGVQIQLAARLGEGGERRGGQQNEAARRHHLTIASDWGKRTGSERSRSFWATVIALAPSRLVSTTTPV